MSHHYLGLAAKRKGAWKSLFAHGSRYDLNHLKIYLQERYQGEAMLTKNGRSALALALMGYFKKGDKVLVNGFTCYAVYEAVKAAGLEPVFVDISKNDLNFTVKTLEAAWTDGIKGVIVQNTLGNPVDIDAISKFAEQNGILIIEDLAHCAGIKYPNGKEVGTVGAATALSFGKDKSIDTVTGGAVIFRVPRKNQIKMPSVAPKKSDNARARVYPMLSAICRGMTYFHLSGVFMRMFMKFHWIERSADNKLDLKVKPSKFEAKQALKQLKELKLSESPLRNFYLVNHRDEVLEKLRKAGYYFDGFWYEKPVSPVRYYKKVNFPEESCPVATEVAEKIINIPTHYKKEELLDAKKIIKEYL